MSTKNNNIKNIPKQTLENMRKFVENTTKNNYQQQETLNQLNKFKDAIKGQNIYHNNDDIKKVMQELKDKDQKGINTLKAFLNNKKYDKNSITYNPMTGNLPYLSKYPKQGVEYSVSMQLFSTAHDVPLPRDIISLPDGVEITHTSTGFDVGPFKTPNEAVLFSVYIGNQYIKHEGYGYKMPGDPYGVFNLYDKDGDPVMNASIDFERVRERTMPLYRDRNDSKEELLEEEFEMNM